MKKNIIVCLVILSVIASVLFISTGSLRAQNAAGDSDILRKLDAILTNQKAIMESINFIKQEMAVIKMRVTQLQ
ncbi:MAG: hypothetical protein WC738_01495 [Candidatus Omnitrophota bacterium]